MFFEVCVSGATSIGFAESIDGIQWRYNKIVLDPLNEKHLAFPNVFKYNGNYYMIPDTDQGRVVLYEATNFPEVWVKKATLVDDTGKKFNDTTIIPFEDKFWMFSSNYGHCYLYYSDDLTSGWIEHKTKIAYNSNNRLAGRAFYWNNKIVRIVQNHIDRTVNVYQVDILTTENYQESPIHSNIIGSDKSKWHSYGMHTFNPYWADGKWLIAVDGWNSCDGVDFQIGIYKSE
jgi:hypothetical protein